MMFHGMLRNILGMSPTWGCVNGSAFVLRVFGKAEAKHILVSGTSKKQTSSHKIRMKVSLVLSGIRVLKKVHPHDPAVYSNKIIWTLLDPFSFFLLSS